MGLLALGSHHWLASYCCLAPLQAAHSVWAETERLKFSGILCTCARTMYMYMYTNHRSGFGCLWLFYYPSNHRSGFGCLWLFYYPGPAHHCQLYKWMWPSLVLLPLVRQVFVVMKWLMNLRTTSILVHLV